MNRSRAKLRLAGSAGAIGVLGLLAGLTLAFGAAPATAKTAYVFGTSFAGSGTNALSSPTGIAVDNSDGASVGDVYVSDTAKHRVEKFDSAGNFLLMFGKGVNSGVRQSRRLYECRRSDGHLPSGKRGLGRRTVHDSVIRRRR